MKSKILSERGECTYGKKVETEGAHDEKFHKFSLKKDAMLRYTVDISCTARFNSVYVQVSRGWIMDPTLSRTGAKFEICATIMRLSQGKKKVKIRTTKGNTRPPCARSRVVKCHWPYVADQTDITVNC